MENRVILIVLDGCGAGSTPDYNEFDETQPASTIYNVIKNNPPLQLPNLEKIGFLNACGVPGRVCYGNYGRILPLSRGKDSVTGHWEMMGIVTEQPFPTYPTGFPSNLIKSIEETCSTTFIGNKAASGTQIISELGELHINTKHPILYTSADSVMQIAAHEEIIPLEKLYEICIKARNICKEPNNIQRIIARPFIGNIQKGFTRTQNRKDYPLPAPINYVDEYNEQFESEVFGIGVVPELFNGRGFKKVKRTQNNKEHFEMLLEAMKTDSKFIFANFEDFDMLYGHRNDVTGFGKCLEEFDKYLGIILNLIGDNTMIILTADHGNDPTTKSTDHSREYVPFVSYTKNTLPTSTGDRTSMGIIAEEIRKYIH